MRTALSLFLTLLATAAPAHVGHLGAFAGHDHWVAAGALGVAGLIAVWGALKGGKAEPETDEPEETGTADA